MMRGSFFGSVGDIFLALIILLEFKMDLNSIRDAANIMGRLFPFSSRPIEAAQTVEIDMSTGSIKVFDMDQRNFNVQYSIDGESNIAFESVKQQIVDYERMNGREFAWSNVEERIFNKKNT